jgi:hypothetical protein
MGYFTKRRLFAKDTLIKFISIFPTEEEKIQELLQLNFDVLKEVSSSKPRKLTFISDDRLFECSLVVTRRG